MGESMKVKVKYRTRKRANTNSGMLEKSPREYLRRRKAATLITIFALAVLSTIDLADYFFTL